MLSEIDTPFLAIVQDRYQYLTAKGDGEEMFFVCAVTGAVVASTLEQEPHPLTGAWKCKSADSASPIYLRPVPTPAPGPLSQLTVENAEVFYAELPKLPSKSELALMLTRSIRGEILLINAYKLLDGEASGDTFAEFHRVIRSPAMLWFSGSDFKSVAVQDAHHKLLGWFATNPVKL